MKKKSANENKTEGTLFVLSAPSGAGKTTVTQKILKQDRNLVRSVSWTTRLRRVGEKDKQDYFFVTPKRFLDKREKDGFLEWAKVFNQYYGTPKSFVNQKLKSGKDVVLVIDTRGAKKVKKQTNCVLIFLKAPTMKVLKERLFKRNTDSKKEIEKRLKEVKYEMGQASFYDYKVASGTILQTVKEIKQIIQKERLRKRNK